MVLMDRHTGKAISDFEHLKQSVEDILTTMIGSRVMRRDYGSRIPEYVDYPLNADTVTLIYGAAIDALDIWEPRLLIDRVTVDKEVANISAGNFVLILEGFYIPTGDPIRLDNIKVSNKEILNNG